MELKKKLIEHPFYQMWMKGELTFEQLADYHKSYAEFIEMIPILWAKVVTDFKLETSMSDEIVKDETEHVLLWKKWEHKLPDISDYHSMKSIIDEIGKMSTSELLGAIHAFEVQQPEIATTKKNGLKEHYGYNDEELLYFDEHINEEDHIRFGKEIAEKYANKSAFQNGFERASELYYSGMDMFMN